MSVIAISGDSAAGVARHRARDKLSSIELVADPKLEQIDALGLRRESGLPFATTYVLGIPIGVPKLPRSMAVPTSVLVDNRGVVKWIDQADDYRLRSASEVIEKALEASYGVGVAEA